MAKLLLALVSVCWITLELTASSQHQNEAPQVSVPVPDGADDNQLKKVALTDEHPLDEGYSVEHRRTNPSLLTQQDETSFPSKKTFRILNLSKVERMRDENARRVKREGDDAICLKKDLTYGMVTEDCDLGKDVPGCGICGYTGKMGDGRMYCKCKNPNPYIGTPLG